MPVGRRSGAGRVPVGRRSGAGRVPVGRRSGAGRAPVGRRLGAGWAPVEARSTDLTSCLKVKLYFYVTFLGVMAHISDTLKERLKPYEQVGMF